MTHNLMIQGTMSNAGKSIVTAALCRILRQDGFRVAPFKSQNMALNSFVTRDGGEMSRAQAVQAEACGILPDVRMNPLLLKPTGNHTSRVVLLGRELAVMPAAEYMELRPTLIPQVMEAYESLAREYDVIVIEGAGSPVELNLNRQDIVNMGLAKMVDAPVLLVGDIDRGGIFAQLYGTVALLKEEERRRLKGMVVNKFRGDLELLKPGLATLEKLCGVPVVGTIPMMDVELEDEDSLSDRLTPHRPRKALDIAVVHLPHLAAFSDFSPLELYDDVSVRYIREPADFGTPALAILPGSSDSLADLEWLRASGLADTLRHHIAGGGLLLGIGAGYQMLGRELRDPDHVESARTERAEGLGLLEGTTVFHREKVQRRSTGRLGAVPGDLASLSGLPYDGYEVHSGRPAEGESARPVLEGRGTVYGTYLHGLLEQEEIRRALLARLAEREGVTADLHPFDLKAHRERQFDRLSKGVRQALDMELVCRIIDRKV